MKMTKSTKNFACKKNISQNANLGLVFESGNNQPRRKHPKEARQTPQSRCCTPSRGLGHRAVGQLAAQVAHHRLGRLHHVPAARQLHHHHLLERRPQRWASSSKPPQNAIHKPDGNRNALPSREVRFRSKLSVRAGGQLPPEQASQGQRSADQVTHKHYGKIIDVVK